MADLPRHTPGTASRRVLLLVPAVLVALAAGGVAGAARSDTELIRHGVGIGSVRLGMTEAQVRRALGRPTAVIRRRTGFGGVRLELQFDQADYTVELRRRAGRFQVVAVSTILARERTREGFGVGTLERRVRGAYGRRLRCEPLRTRLASQGRSTVRVLASTERNCVLTTQRGTETVFRSVLERRSRWDWILTPADWPRARVYIVTIRAAGS
jgi:hypothetical protein